MYTLEELKQKNLKELKEIGWQLNVLPDGDRRCRRNWIKALVGVQPTLLQLLEVSPGVETVQELIEVQAIGQIEIQAIEPIAPAAETSPSVPEGDRPLVLTKDAAETFPGVSRKTLTARQLLEQFKSSAVILGDSPAAETEAETLESAIGLAAKNLLDAEADQNPILTNITFSPGFLARYSSPQTESIHYQSDADGQLSLLDFEVESVDEPPDPDDFESLNAFREAVSLWDNIPNRWKFPSTLSASGHRVQTTGTSRHHPKCWNSHRRSSPRAALTKVPAFANS